MADSIPDGSHILAEALPTSLDELFSRAPLERSPADLEMIVRKLRADREKWAKDEAEGKKRATPAKAEKSPKQTFSMDDLL